MNSLHSVLPDMLTASLVAFLVAALGAPLIYKLLLKLNSRQTVSQFVPEHAGKQGTPTMGGLVVVVAVFVAMLTVDHGRFTVFSGTFIWFAMIGFLDDFAVPRWMKSKRGLDWMPKLALQIVPFAVMPFVPPFFDVRAAAVLGFVVLFFANAYNFADGLDGLAGGLGAILALTFLAVQVTFASLDSSMQNVNYLFQPEMLALFFALIPFLVLNAPPAKVFMGDVGSLPIGALLGFAYFFLPGVTGKAYSLENGIFWPILLVLLVLIVEIVPGPLQIASAKLRKGKRLFPFRTPVHHAFQAAGWPETRVVALFLLTQVLASGAALWLLAWTLRGAQ